MTLEGMQHIYIAQGLAHSVMARSIKAQLQTVPGNMLDADAKLSLRIIAAAHEDAARRMNDLVNEIKAAGGKP